MPNLIGHQLIVRILHDITDFGRLVFLAYLLHENPIEHNGAGPFTMRSQYRFQMPQQGSLTGTGLAAENNIFSSLNGKAYLFQRFIPSGCGIGKAQIFDFEMCH